MNHSKSIIKKYAWLTLFFISMGYLESAVVVYLREIYYPNGFAFPLAALDMDIAVTEIIREAFTLLMLLSVGFLAGRTLLEKIAMAFFGFGVWDIFYYIFLKLLLGWPESLLTWDILFLIPVTWTGPVISPVIIAACMILFSLMVSHLTNYSHKIALKNREILIIIGGVLIAFIAFIWDYLQFLNQHIPLSKIYSADYRDEVIQIASQYIPVTFPWIIFTMGSILIILGMVMFYKREKDQLILDQS